MDCWFVLLYVLKLPQLGRMRATILRELPNLEEDQRS